MPRLNAIDPATATGKTKELLDGVQKKLGSTPNIFRTFANSPAVLEGYLSFSGALGQGVLSAKVREQIALIVGQTNSCDYCLAAHSTIGKMVGLGEDELLAARQGDAQDPQTAAILRFARKLVTDRGNVSDQDTQGLRAAGLGDAEISEIVANVALNLFTNYFNHVAGTEVDFPAAPEVQAA